MDKIKDKKTRKILAIVIKVGELSLVAPTEKILYKVPVFARFYDKIQNRGNHEYC